MGVLLKGIHEMNGVILEGTNNGAWHFQLRFPDQREALVLALDRGYFATPSEASLDELAEDLDITH